MSPWPSSRALRSSLSRYFSNTLRELWVVARKRTSCTCAHRRWFESRDEESGQLTRCRSTGTLLDVIVVRRGC
jgi:hypothetical protein